MRIIIGDEKTLNKYWIILLEQIKTLAAAAALAGRAEVVQAIVPTCSGQQQKNRKKKKRKKQHADPKFSQPEKINNRQKIVPFFFSADAICLGCFSLSLVGLQSRFGGKPLRI